MVVTAHVQEKPAVGISYEEAREAVERLHAQFGGSELFGRERDDSLKSSLAAVMQTFDGKDLYPSLEAKAVNLLYFLVKNRSFVDGMLYRPDGAKRIADNALVALTIMIAASDPCEKDIIVTPAINLINRRTEQPAGLGTSAGLRVPASPAPRYPLGPALHP